MRARLLSAESQLSVRALCLSAFQTCTIMFVNQIDTDLSATYCTGPYGKFAVDLKDYEVCVICMRCPYKHSTPWASCCLKIVCAFDITFKILPGFIPGGRRHWNHTHGLHTRMVMFSGCRNCIKIILLSTTDCMDTLCDSHFTFCLAYVKLLGSWMSSMPVRRRNICRIWGRYRVPPWCLPRATTLNVSFRCRDLISTAPGGVCLEWSRGRYFYILVPRSPGARSW